ncbi:hypothetical protein [Bradyrhizobium sp. BR 10289]|uniref:hypothetical protein n=1 Tax=Bradyrhizobium sp. BR 10289 TaxID=2749993 RepID=UPI001C645499|nr:hypothetical protein [Bradyrhizobium sp. BR 10289]MBW7970942.1 hypothetical protein [Bradyrhizobium sp. BR 10289]
MTIQITVHPAAKKFSEGYVPMITLRGAQGRMLGCRTPEGGYREFRTFTNDADAVTEARNICARMVSMYPDVLKACASMSAAVSA